MADLGRISGQMLAADLLRSDVDLAFDTDHLYLDVDLNGIGGVGINTDAFTRTLEINQDTRTVRLIADRLVQSSITIENNSISTLSGPLYLSAAGGQTGTILLDRTEVDDLYFDGNVIGSKTSNTNIVLDPSGSGTVDFLDNVNIYDDIYLTGNIIAAGNVVVGGQIDIGTNPEDTVQINPVFSQDLKPNTDGIYNLGSSSRRWLNLYLGDYVDLENIRIEGNTIKTTISNSNLELSGSGSGGIKTEDLVFSNNSIRATTNNIDITPSVIFDKNNAVTAPVGTTANRSVLSLGEFRYNTDRQNFEGYTTSKVFFNGISDSDYNTRVFTDLTRSTDDNTLRFYVSGTEKFTISENTVTAGRISVNNNIQLDSSQSKLSTTQLNSDIFLQPSGTGVVSIADTGFGENSIIGKSGNLILGYTGNGYYTFSGSNGVVIPSGPTITTPPVSTQIGDFRFNTSTGNLEVFNGISYGLAVGAGEEVTQSQLEEIIDLYTVIFG